MDSVAVPELGLSPEEAQAFVNYLDTTRATLQGAGDDSALFVALVLVLDRFRDCGVRPRRRADV